MYYASKNSRLPTLVIFLFSLLALTPTYALIYVNIPGVSGDLTVNGIPGHIEVYSWSWGETNDPVGGEGTLNDFTMVLPVSKASPKLLESFAAGRVIEEVTTTTVVQTTLAEAQVLEISLTDVIISYHQTGGILDDGSIPTETLSLNFDKITWKYWPIGPSGSVGPTVSRTCDNPARQSP